LGLFSFYLKSLNLIYPTACSGCGRRLSFKEKYLCQCCLASIKFIETKCGWCGRALSKEILACGECHFNPPPYEKARAVGEYQTPLKELICSFKYQKKEGMKRLAWELMFKYLEKGEEIDLKRVDLIIPVPLHKTKRHERGFNQATALAEGIAQRYQLKIEQDNLVRIRKTFPQVNLPTEKRTENVKSAFYVKREEKIKGKNILLIDDVYTTGATIKECTKVLKKAGSGEIYVFTLARAPAG
jgi:ComF family protein